MPAEPVGDGGEEQQCVFINRPLAKEHKIEYQPPPAASNPVLRGLPLYYLAQLVVKSSLVQNVLWSLNGFGKLRDRPELEDVEPRYLPNVVRAPTTQTTSLREGEYLSTLNDEDWHSRAPPAKGPVFASVLDYSEAYRSGEVTPVDVVEALLPLVRKGAKHGTAFLCVKAEMVRKAAEESRERWRVGKARSLVDGVVMAVKDEEDLAGHTRSLGTKLDFRHKDDNATSYCVQKWIDAGAICLGKTTMHEMGMDTTNNNPNHGTPLNPYDERYYCGGSSGGSAYAVAAGLMPFAMGNDGGGSIRIPAAYCGLFGLKTTHGRVSVRPTANLARSTGVAGPIAANMVDLEIAYRIMAEPDRLDPESVLFSPPRGRKAPRGRTLGVCRAWFERADAEARMACEEAMEWLEREEGYRVVDIGLPLLAEGQLAHALTIMTEVLSGCTPSTLASLTPPNKILLAVASQTRSLDFLQAQRLRNLQMQHLAHLFTQHPGLIILTPTTPNAGWPVAKPSDASPEPGVGYGLSDGNTQLRNMEYAYLANFVGCPALSAPVGYLEPAAKKGVESGEGEAGRRVPVGLMGMGEWGSEDELVGFGFDVERFLHLHAGKNGEGDGGGRVRPGNFVDVLRAAAREQGK